MTNGHDDELIAFAERGAPPLPIADLEGHVDHEGAKVWYASFGSGPVAVLLHGGLGHSGNWGNQVPALVASGRRVVVIDSRGHGRSTRDERPFTYESMASDVLAVLDSLQIERAAFVGWSDGACVALIAGATTPDRVDGVFFFACNMDPSGTLPMDFSNPLLGRCYGRHVKDYASLSTTPDDFEAFSAAVNRMMETEPNYTPDDLAKIGVPVAIVQGEHDEFIRREHAEYLAKTIPGAELQILPKVTHFAPLQRPHVFNRSVLDFLDRIQSK